MAAVAQSVELLVVVQAVAGSSPTSRPRSGIMHGGMDISLIIPAHNEEKVIGRCLECALRNGAGKFKEIIVVDNASTDATARIASGYPGVRVVREPRRGTGHARQTGAEHAVGDILAYIDADVEIPIGWVAYIERVFNERQDVVFLSGPYRYMREEGARYPTWLLNAVWWITPPVYWIVGYMGNGGNCAMRASALRAAGGHGREFAFYGDDTDLARRMRAVGKTLWRLRFNNVSSPRRFEQRGLVPLCFAYILNYWWPVLFGRPFSPGHHDLRR